MGTNAICYMHGLKRHIEHLYVVFLDWIRTSVIFLSMSPTVKFDNSHFTKNIRCDKSQHSKSEQKLLPTELWVENLLTLVFRFELCRPYRYVCDVNVRVIHLIS